MVIIGELSIDLGGGVTLTATTDLALAEKWAEFTHGEDAWRTFSAGQRSCETAAALRALRLAVEDLEIQQ